MKLKVVFFIMLSFLFFSLFAKLPDPPPEITGQKEVVIDEDTFYEFVNPDEQGYTITFETGEGGWDSEWAENGHDFLADPSGNTNTRNPRNGLRNYCYSGTMSIKNTTTKFNLDSLWYKGYSSAPALTVKGYLDDVLKYTSEVYTTDQTTYQKMVFTGWNEMNRIELVAAEQVEIDDILYGIPIGDLFVKSSIEKTYTLTIQSGNDYSIDGLKVVPDKDFFGELTVPVVVNDGVADSLPYNFKISVTDVYDAPDEDVVPDEDIVLDADVLVDDDIIVDEDVAVDEDIATDEVVTVDEDMSETENEVADDDYFVPDSENSDDNEVSDVVQENDKDQQLVDNNEINDIDNEDADDKDSPKKSDGGCAVILIN